MPTRPSLIFGAATSTCTSVRCTLGPASGNDSFRCSIPLDVGLELVLDTTPTTVSDPFFYPPSQPDGTTTHRTSAPIVSLPLPTHKVLVHTYSPHLMPARVMQNNASHRTTLLCTPSSLTKDIRTQGYTCTLCTTVPLGTSMVARRGQKPLSNRAIALPLPGNHDTTRQIVLRVPRPQTNLIQTKPNPIQPALRCVPTLPSNPHPPPPYRTLPYLPAYFFSLRVSPCPFPALCPPQQTHPRPRHTTPSRKAIIRHIPPIYLSHNVTIYAKRKKPITTKQHASEPEGDGGFENFSTNSVRRYLS